MTLMAAEANQPEDLSDRLTRLDTGLAALLDREPPRRHWTETLLPLLSLLVALAGIVAGTVVQVVSLRAQASLKQYEVTFIAKQKSYADVLASIHQLFAASTEGSRDDFARATDKLQANAYSVQPFLRSTERDALWEDIQLVIQTCLAAYKERQTFGGSLDAEIKSFTERRDKVKDRLVRDLFPDYPR